MLERFRSRSVYAGNEVFLRVRDAVELVEAVEKEDLAFLGFEAFEFDERYVKPRLDYIADFSPRPRRREGSWSEYHAANIASSRAFLAIVPADLAVVSVLWTRQRWEAMPGIKREQSVKDENARGK